jgi:hypothetical protein
MTIAFPVSAAESVSRATPRNTWRAPGVPRMKRARLSTRCTKPTTPAGIAALLKYVSEHIRERGLGVWGADGVVEFLATVRAAAGGGA